MLKYFLWIKFMEIRFRFNGIEEYISFFKKKIFDMYLYFLFRIVFKLFIIQVLEREYGIQRRNFLRIDNLQILGVLFLFKFNFILESLKVLDCYRDKRVKY